MGHPDLTTMAPSVTIPSKCFFAERNTDSIHNEAMEAIYSILITTLSPIMLIDNEIGDALRMVITDAYHKTATGHKHFRFRPGIDHTSSPMNFMGAYRAIHQSNDNSPVIFCLVPVDVVKTIYNLTNSALMDRPTDDMVDKNVSLFSPNLRDAYRTYKTLRDGDDDLFSPTGITRFSETVYRHMDGEWKSAVGGMQSARLFMATMPDQPSTGTGDPASSSPSRPPTSNDPLSAAHPPSDTPADVTRDSTTNPPDTPLRDNSSGSFSTMAPDNSHPNVSEEGNTAQDAPADLPPSKETSHSFSNSPTPTARDPDMDPSFPTNNLSSITRDASSDAPPDAHEPTPEDELVSHAHHLSPHAQWSVGTGGSIDFAASGDAPSSAPPTNRPWNFTSIMRRMMTSRQVPPSTQKPNTLPSTSTQRIHGSSSASTSSPTTLDPNVTDLATVPEFTPVETLPIPNDPAGPSSRPLPASIPVDPQFATSRPTNSTDPGPTNTNASAHSVDPTSPSSAPPGVGPAPFDPYASTRAHFNTPPPRSAAPPLHHPPYEHHTAPPPGPPPSPPGNPPHGNPPSDTPPHGGSPGDGRSSGPPPSHQPPSGPPTPGPPTDSEGTPLTPGIDWREFRVDPHALSRHVIVRTKTVGPWIFPRPETGSRINYGVQFHCFLCDKASYLASISSPRLGSPTYSMKEFLYSFPRLPESAEPSHIFDFLNNVVRYCVGASVYVPPLHTLTFSTHTGLWYSDLPAHCINSWDYYDQALQQALQCKTTNLVGSDLTRHLCHAIGGYYILRELAMIAGHPALATQSIDIAMPRQKSNMSLTSYQSQWNYYLHMLFLRGIFLSDRYFLESFVQHLHSVFNSNAKPLMLTFIRDLPRDTYVPLHFHPSHLVSYLCQAVQSIGMRGLTPTTTPRDYANSRSRPSPSSRSLPPSSHPVRQVVDSPDILDLRQLDTLDDDLYLTICSLMQTSRSCDLCSSSDHLIARCPKALAIAQDPQKARRLQHLLESAATSRGGTPSPSSSSRPGLPPREAPTARSHGARTPPASNSLRSLATPAADDTDEDATIASLNTDDGSVGTLPDF